ncbi:DUF2314 domain-containing protein [Mucilaginibacter angelicae]|uniref:DUF2314 domain-containing protein n=1 Tax=Mucilaginibacter angelicae TaxID=869718 RepID=A0ABV6L6Y2_9SPHI
MLGFFKKKKTAEPKSVVAGLSANDNLLQEFKAKAQEQLPYLIEFMENHEEGDELFRYAVKTNFVEGDNTEHMWVQVDRFKDGLFIGKLANKPSAITHIKYGDPIEVSQHNVEDWILQDFLTNTKVGGFSSGYVRENAK